MGEIVAFEIICRRYFVIICRKHLILPALPDREELGLAPMWIQVTYVDSAKPVESRGRLPWRLPLREIVAKATPNSSQNNTLTLPVWGRGWITANPEVTHSALLSWDRHVRPVTPAKGRQSQRPDTATVVIP
jgi:hypothetical protein